MDSHKVGRFLRHCVVPFWSTLSP